MRRRGVLMLAAACVLGCGKAAPKDRYGQVADFTLTERSGKQVQHADLHDKVWVAAFVFTRCAGPCTQISGSMARLQKELADEKDVVLVSFTVDPDYDTPEVLRDYAQRFGAEPDRWLFLTGKREAMHQLIRESFHLGVEKATGTPQAGNEVVHSSRLAVVDRRGEIRGYYDGKDENDLARLKTKVAELVKEQP